MLRQMRRNVHAAGLCLLCSLIMAIWPATALGQEGVAMGSVVGLLLDTDGNTPVENAIMIFLRVEDGQEFRSLLTDQNGMYKIDPLPPGHYKVRALLGAAGRKPDEEEKKYDDARKLKEVEPPSLPDAAPVPEKDYTFEQEVIIVGGEQAKVTFKLYSRKGLALLLLAGGGLAATAGIIAAGEEEPEASPAR